MIEQEPELPKPLGWIRRLYNWTLSWAERPGGVWALFVLAVVESSMFPIPADVLLLALCVGAVRRSFWFATVCATGSVLGGLLGYGIGWGFWNVAEPFFIPHIFSEGLFLRVQELYHGNAFLAILTAAFTPIPYKVFTITAGVFELNLGIFLVASIAGRSARFFLVAGLMFYFGAPIKEFIEKNFDILVWVLFALVILGFLAIKGFQ